MSKTKKPYWKKTTPTVDGITLPPALEGWYWCKYKGKYGTIICPCDVTWLNDETFFVRTARNDTYTNNTAKKFGAIWFGDRIKAPGDKK